jgi:hypothetical protein
LALVVLCYLYPFPFFQRLHNPNENVRIWQTRAIAQYGEIDLRRVVDDWGPVDDAAFAGDRLVSSKAPGVSLLGVPIYAAQLRLHRLAGLPPPSQAGATHVLRIVGVALPMAAFLLFFARWIERETGATRVRDLLLVGLGLGSPMYAYGMLFAGHLHGAALGFIAFALLSSAPARTGPRGLLLTAGVAGGFAVVFEYQLAILLGILCVWALLRQGRAGAWLLIGAVPAVALLGAYHTLLFGQPWAFPYGHLANPGYAQQDHGRGFFGLVLPSGTALLDLMFSLRRGLFVFSPFLALGIWGALLSLGRGRRDAAIVALTAMAAMFLFQAGMSNWTAGWSVGPRYIVVVAPLLTAAISGCYRWVPEPIFIPILGGMVIASVFLCGLSGAMFPHYPAFYRNPVFDLTVPLLRSGRAPYNLGRTLGLPGAWSMAPLALVAASAVVAAMSSREPPGGHAWRARLGALSIAVAIGTVYLSALSLVAHASPGQREANAQIESIWEPMP